MTTYTTLVTLTIPVLILTLCWLWVDLAETRRQLTEERARVWALRRALSAADSNRQIVLNGRVWRRYRMDRSPTQLPIHRN